MVTDERLMDLTRKAFPDAPNAWVGIHEDVGGGVYCGVSDTIAYAHAHPKAREAVEASLLVLAGEKHPDLAAAESTIDDLREKFAKALTEAERHQKAAHDERNRSQAVAVAFELTIRKLSAWDEDAARLARADLEAALRAPSSVPPAAEDTACARSFVP